MKAQKKLTETIVPIGRVNFCQQPEAKYNKQTPNIKPSTSFMPTAQVLNCVSSG